MAGPAGPIAKGAASKAADNPGAVLVLGLIAVLALGRAVEGVRRNLPRIPEFPAIKRPALPDIFKPPEPPEYWDPFEEFWEEDLQPWGQTVGGFFTAPSNAADVDPVIVPRPVPVDPDVYRGEQARDYIFDIPPELRGLR